MGGEGALERGEHTLASDVTFREDANTTLNKQATQNWNIIRKWSLSILKMMEIMKLGLSLKKCSLRLAFDRYSI